MGYITLLSDLGLQDASVAIARGILMQYSNDTILDITHEIAPFNTKQAAYLLRCAYGNFPAGTWHVLLFDLFSERHPSLLLCAHNGHYFFTPDNGLLPLAIGSAPERAWRCAVFENSETFTDWLHGIGNVMNRIRIDQAAINGLEACSPKIIQPGKALPSGILNCEVIHIDQYENVVIDVTRQEFETLRQGRQFRLQFMQVEEISEISNSYSDAREGYKLCRFNSNGHMEICINRGRAASLFGLRMGGRNNDIKILFE